MLFERIRAAKDTDAKPASRDMQIYLNRCLHIIGLLFPKGLGVFSYIYSIFINFGITFYLPLSFLLSYTIRFDELVVSQFLASLSVGINVWVCSCKVLIIAIMRKRLQNSVKYMDELDARVTRHEDYQKIREVVAFCNFVVFLLVVVFWTYATTAFLAGLLSGSPPYAVYYPFINWRNSKKEFYIQSLIEFASLGLVCIEAAVSDAIPIVYINIIRTHIRLLADRIKRVSENEEGLSDDGCYEELVQCILDHKTICKLFNEIGPIVSRTIFLQFLDMGLIIGFTLFNIASFANTSGMMASLFYILSVMVETFPCCFYANCLIDDNNDLTLAIAHSSWEKRDKRFKKALAFFMQNTQRTLVYTAMKLFPINLASNLTVAKFAFSVYALMSQIDLGEKFNKN